MGVHQDSTIDGLLRSLNDRPNVDATLILSRKDGTIIKSAGFAVAQQRQRALTSGPEPPSDQIKTQEDGGSEEQVKATPAEELAASVFQFMTAAGSLGSTLAAVSAGQGRGSGSFQQERGSNKSQPGDDEPPDANPESADAQVQLLRVRIKHKEVIIFPDPQYICCVVQRVGKQAATESR
jgi:hypothetical protein